MGEPFPSSNSFLSSQSSVVKSQGPRALVVGATGQVGAQMMKMLAVSRGPGYALPSSSGQPVPDGFLSLDLATLDEVGAERLLSSYCLDSVYCVAGMTDVERCEDSSDLAWRTNARGPAVLAAHAQQRGVPFLCYSTEYVFDGDPQHPGPYTETDPARPLSVYGRSKLEGEHAVLAAHPGALVLRTTVVYGPDERGKNYVYSLMRHLGAGRRMRVPSDQVSTPTYNRDLVRTSVGMMEAGASGIYHVCGPELLSRMEFALRIAAALGLDEDLLDPVPTCDLGQRAARPLAAGMAIGKLEREFPALRMRTLEEALRDCELELRQFLNKVTALQPAASR